MVDITQVPRGRLQGGGGGLNIFFRGRNSHQVGQVTNAQLRVRVGGDGDGLRNRPESADSVTSDVLRSKVLHAALLLFYLRHHPL